MHVYLWVCVYVRESAWLLISGQVGERLIHLVGDRFVLVVLVRHLVCEAKRVGTWC